MSNISKLKKYIFDLISEEIKTHGIVVWYDPHCFYTSIIDDKKNIKIPVLKFENSYFNLRSTIEPYFNKLERPELIVYIAKPQDKCIHPLIEIEKAGSVLSPEGSLRINTSPSVLIREALKKTVSVDYLNEIVSKVDKGVLSLEEVEKLVDKHEPINTGTLSLIFNSDDPLSIILSFISDESLDKSLKEKKAIKELKELINLFTGFSVENKKDFLELRTFVSEYILLYDFFSHFNNTELGRFSSLLLDVSVQVQNINNLVQQWRLRHNLWDCYQEFSSSVEKKYNLNEFVISVEKLIDIDTFAFIEDRFISHLCELDASANILLAKQTLENRKSKFWYKSLPEIGLVYTVLNYGIDLKISIQESLSILKNENITFESLLNLYIGTSETNGWFESDHFFRLLENKYFDLDVSPSYADKLELFVNSCRNTYSAYLSKQSVSFISLLKGKGTYLSSKWQKQSKIFNDVVFQNINNKIKTAYILVDAFRYEMAVEFLSLLDNKVFSYEISPALSSVPTITNIGMLSLLLYTGDSISLNSNEEKLLLKVSEKSIKIRDDRFSYLSAKLGFNIEVLKLADTVQPKRGVVEKLKKSDFIIVTSQEIDKINEDGNEILAKQTMDDMLKSIKRSVTNLSSNGFSEIIIVSDHGFLLGAEIGKDNKIEFPNGTGYEKHKRCWIGRGGHNPANCLRLTSKKFGYNSDFDFVFPDGVGLFSTTGGENSFFHGGLSLQEIVIPVIKLKSLISKKSSAAFDNYSLSFAKAQITNRIFTIKAEFSSSELSFDVSEPLKKRVRFNILSDSIVVGKAEASDYGFNETTKEIELQNNIPNVITVVLSESENISSVDIIMIDSATELELKKIEQKQVKLTF